MPKPFDSATKELLARHPEDWLQFVDAPFGSATLLDTDLSGISAAADKLIRVDAEEPYIAHIELQASYEPRMAHRFQTYNVNADYREDLPVVTTVFLLRPEADGANMRVPFARRLGAREPHHQFRFDVVRLWEEPAERFLSGGLGVLPLAPLCNDARADLPGVVRRMEERIQREAEAEDGGVLWTATLVLMGLRYRDPLISSLLKGVRGMKESVTYQAILEEGEAKGVARGRAEGKMEGKAEGERNLVLLVGSRRFGQPSANVLAALNAIAEPSRLERLALRLLEVESWTELLAEN